MAKLDELQHQLMNKSADFDWFNHNLNTDDNQCNQIKLDDSTEDVVYDWFVSLIRQMFYFTLILKIFILTFGFNKKIVLGIYLYKLVNYILIQEIGLIILDIALQLSKKLIILLSFQRFIQKYQSIIKFGIIIVWFCNMYLHENIIENELLHERVTRFLKSAILFMITMIISNIISIKFKKYFIKKALSAKIKQVIEVEEIIRKMKAYIKENHSSQDTSSTINTVEDIFCLEILNKFAKFNYEESEILIQEPELPNVTSAASLAKQVFTKASQGDNTLNFEKFAEIFKNPQKALLAFAFFDSDQDRNIDKKEFRDTLIYFYTKRKNLEAAYFSVLNFIQIIDRVWYLSVSIITLIPILIIFGVPIIKIATMMFSSALFIEFTIGHLVNSMIKNCMVIFSHQFDIGDEIILDNEKYHVYKLELSTTTLINTIGGKIEIFNSEFWNKKVINITRSPEHNILFTFELSPTITLDQIRALNNKIHKFLILKIYDYHDNFKLINQSITKTSIDILYCTIILQFKGRKTASKRFYLRIEFTTYLKTIFEELNIPVIK